MSRRKQNRAEPPGPPEQERTPHERWAPSAVQPWQIVLSAACVTTWLAFLTYLALNHGA